MPGTRPAMMSSRGPMIRSVSSPGPQQGVTCCCGCVRCCACINWGYLTSRPGIFKVLQFIMAAMCQSLAVRYGLPYAQDIGSAFEGFLSACSAAFVGSGCLLACYVVSEKSVGLVRNSLFETLHNGVCAVLLLSSGSSLLAAANLFLWPRYLVTPFFQVFPAITAASILGIALGVFHAFDCYLCYRFYRGFR